MTPRLQLLPPALEDALGGPGRIHRGLDVGLHQLQSVGIRLGIWEEQVQVAVDG